MDRIRNMFGGQASDTPNAQAPPASMGNDDESSGLINTQNSSSDSSSGGVFSKGQEMMESMETGPDYKIAAGFLFFSVLFFFAALTSLPMILLSPGSFNLYFCFGSMFLQLALAFYYAPMVYLRKLFAAESRIISVVYISSLLMALYFAWTGASYLVALGCVALQGLALAFFVMQAVGGADTANSWAYAMLFQGIIEKIKAMLPGGGSGGSGKYDQLPI